MKDPVKRKSLLWSDEHQNTKVMEKHGDVTPIHTHSLCGF